MTNQSAVFSKSEVVRVELKDGEYLKFSELNSRLVFSNQELNERKSREESLKFALRTTSLAVKKVLGESHEGLFIADDENALIEKIISNAIAPYQAKSTKVEKLLDILIEINEGTTFSENDIVIPQKQWLNIVNQVAALRAF